MARATEVARRPRKPGGLPAALSLPWADRGPKSAVKQGRFRANRQSFQPKYPKNVVGFEWEGG